MRKRWLETLKPKGTQLEVQHSLASAQLCVTPRQEASCHRSWCCHHSPSSVAVSHQGDSALTASLSQGQTGSSDEGHVPDFRGSETIFYSLIPQGIFLRNLVRHSAKNMRKHCVVTSTWKKNLCQMLPLRELMGCSVLGALKSPKTINPVGLGLTENLLTYLTSKTCVGCAFQRKEPAKL